MSRRRWWMALTFVLALVVGGCTDDGADGSGQADGDAKGDRAPRTETIEAAVEITVTGAATLSSEVTTELTVSRFDPAKKEFSLLTVGLAEFARAPDGQRFRTAFDLAGAYDGPGKYSFGTTGQGASSLSNAFVQIVELRDAEGTLDEANVVKARRFDKALEPCQLEVGTGERSGSLSCPRLGDGDGAEIGLRLTWKA